MRTRDKDLRALFEDNPLSMWIFDPATRKILEANKTAQRTYGYSKKEFVSMCIEDMRYPEDAAAVRISLDLFNRHEADSVRRPELWRHRKSDGSAIFADVMWSRIQFQERPAILATVLKSTDYLQDHALQKNNSEVQSVIQAVNDAFWDWDLATDSLWWSQGIRVLFQYSENEVEPHFSWWRQRIHAEDRDRVIEKLHLHLNSNRGQWEDEYRYRRADGSYAFVMDRGYIIRNAEGKPERMVGTLLDITRRKVAEEQAKIYSDIFNNMQIGLYVYRMDDLEDDTTFRLLTANPASERITGIATADLIGRSLDSCFGELRQRGIVRIYAEVIHSGKAVEFEDIVYGDDRIPTAHFSARFFPLPDQCIGVAFEDVTQRLKSEEKLRWVEKRFQTLAAVLPVGIYQNDAKGNCIYVNEKCAELCGVEAEQLMGRNWARSLHPDDRRRIPALWNESVRRKIPFSAEYRFLRTDGTTVWVLGQAVPEYHENGQFAGFIGSITDITDRKRLENEIIEISGQEQRKIGQALHDRLGQHLTGIAFLAKALAGKLQAQNIPEAEHAEEIARHINQAILRTRDLARILHPVELEENGLIAAFQDLASNASRMFNISCEFHWDPSVVVQDNTRATHLYHIAQEAITNAVKHGLAANINVEMGRQDGQTFLRIVDDGSGVPPDTSASSEGIGLRIMKYRATMIDGELQIGPSENGGTVVECTFNAQEHEPAGKK